MSDLQKNIEAIKGFLESGQRQTENFEFYGSGATRRWNELRLALKETAEAACKDEALEPAVDALAEVYFDLFHNRAKSEMQIPVKVLDAIQRALARLPDAKPEEKTRSVPSDLITTAVAVKEYSVSRSTLLRAGLQSFRKPGSPNAKHKYSRADIANRWPER